MLTQVWTAMCAILLLKYLIARSKYKWTLSNLVHFLRVNLFTKIDLWYWIDHPFQRKKPPDGELVQGACFDPPFSGIELLLFQWLRRRELII